jgi:hypothetical protein
VASSFFRLAYARRSLKCSNSSKAHPVIFSSRSMQKVSCPVPALGQRPMAKAPNAYQDNLTCGAAMHIGRQRFAQWIAAVECRLADAIGSA